MAMVHKKILHGLDGSKGSFNALEEAIELAKRYGAELHTVSVEEDAYLRAIIHLVGERNVQAPWNMDGGL
jgi:nucleotide-binding universal stress UspA family protein